MDDEPDLDTAAGRLKWARTRAGYETAEDFANKLKIKPVTYRAYEIGQNGYSRHAALFAKRLGVTTEWLLTGGAVPEHPVQGPEPEVPTWLPKPRTLMELLAAAMNVAPEDREKRGELRDYANAVHTGLKLIAREPSIEDNPDTLRVVALQVSQAIADAHSSSSKVA